MVLSVTLNPMLDKTVELATLRRGRTQRARRVGAVVGGKGVNVSRQLHRWGVETLALGFLGGETGSQLERLLAAERLPSDFVRVRGMTREGVTYREADGTVTAVFEPQHAVSADEGDALVRRVDEHLDGCDWLVCCGSSPCRASDGLFRRVLQRARDEGVRTALDSYGRAFRAGLEAAPTIVKINRAEYEATFGARLRGAESLRRAARGLLGCGAVCALLTDGPRPACCATREGTWRVVPPRLRAVNPTGSGDSMLAGLLFGLEARWEFGRALRFAAAAGAANAARWEVASAPLRAVGPFLQRVVAECVED